MRLFIAALVFAALSISAAEFGWLESEGHQLRVVANLEAPPRPAPEERGQPLEAPLRADVDEGGLEEVAVEAPVGLTVFVTATEETREGEEAQAGEEVEEGAADPVPPVLPLFHVKVTCGAQVFEATTDSTEGKALFAALPEGVCEVAVIEPGWSFAVTHVSTVEENEVSLSVSRPASLRVRVVDGRGLPVAVAHLSLSNSDGLSVGDALRARLPASALYEPPREVAVAEPAEEGTGEQGPIDVLLADALAEPSTIALAVPAGGELELGGLEAGQYHLSVEAPGYTLGARELQLVAGASSEAVFVLERRASLEVTVEGAEALGDDLTVSLLPSAAEPRDATLVSPGRWRFDDVDPGEARLLVECSGGPVSSQRVLIAAGEARRVTVRVALGAVDVEVTGLAHVASRGSPKRGIPGLSMVRLDCGAAADAMSLEALVSHGAAHFDAVPAGVPCRATVADQPLAGRVDVVAPGRARLELSGSELEFVAPDPDAALYLTLTGPAGATSVSGTGSARLTGLAPGRYQVAGRMNTDAVSADVDVSGGAAQRFLLAAATPRCFSVQAVDAATGEGIDVALVAYEQAPDGSWLAAQSGPLFPTDPPPGTSQACFVGPHLARVALTAGGYEVVVRPADRLELGRVGLTAQAGVSGALAEDIVAGEAGLPVVSGTGSRGSGLRPGDEVLAIDGAATQGLLPEQLSGRLAGVTGTPVRLTLRRAEGVQDVVVLRP